MKRVLVYLIVCLFCVDSFAQTIEWKSPMKAKTGNAFYSFEKVNDSLSYFFSVYPAFLFSSSAVLGSFTSKQEIKTRKLNEIIPNPQSLEDLSSLTLGDKLYIFGLERLNKETKVMLTAINPDLSTFIPLKALISINTQGAKLNAGFASSSDGSMGMVYFLLQDKDKNEGQKEKLAHFVYYIFEESGLVAQGEKQLTFKTNYIGDFKPYITNDANVILGYTEFEKKRNKESPNMNKPVAMHFINVNQNGYDDYSFDFRSHQVLSSVIDLNEEGRLKLNGGYSLANDNLLEGVFVFEVDLVKNEIVTDKFTKIGKNVTFIQKTQAVFSNKSQDDWFTNDYKLKKTTYLEESIVFIFEEDYVFESQSMDSRGLVQSRAEYFHNNILILVTDGSGEALYSKIIYKHQRSFIKDDPMHSFESTFDSENIFILFNAPQNYYDLTGEPLL